MVSFHQNVLFTILLSFAIDNYYWLKYVFKTSFHMVCNLSENDELPTVVTSATF